MNTVIVTIPMKTVSALNVREHHMVRHRRVKNERVKVRLALTNSKAKRPPPMLRVTLTRIGPGHLDSQDNLRSALKGTVDQVACWLGLDDGSTLVEWVYRQEQGEYAVRAEIEPLWVARLVPVE